MIIKNNKILYVMVNIKQNSEVLAINIKIDNPNNYDKWFYYCNNEVIFLIEKIMITGYICTMLIFLNLKFL